MEMLTSIFSILIFNSLVIANGFVEADEYKLQQLQVLFRHGDRTPTPADIYEGDPYDEIYKSIGYGQLTKVGKEREYKIGQFLRKRYDSFLNDYRIDDVYAYSSDVDRTKMSLQLLLAGLYPPTPSTSWSDSVNWQPIPTHYEAEDIGFLTAVYFYCDKYNKMYQDVAYRPEILETYKSYQELFEKITNNTGINISQLFTIGPIYSNLRAALSLGFPLPSWCSKDDFAEIEKIAAIGFKAMTYTEQLRRIFTGPIVRQLLTILKENNPKKIYLYGGHEFNIAGFIDAHNITGAPLIQDYVSALILERLRGSDERRYIRVYLWTGVTEKLILLKINNCEETCSLSDYERIAQTILPNEESRVCSTSSRNCNRLRRMKSADGVEKLDLDLQLARLFAGADLASFKYMKNN